MSRETKKQLRTKENFWLDHRIRLIESLEDRTVFEAKQKKKKFRSQKRIEWEKERKRYYYERSKIHKDK